MAALTGFAISISGLGADHTYLFSGPSCESTQAVRRRHRPLPLRVSVMKRLRAEGARPSAFRRDRKRSLVLGYRSFEAFA